MKNIMFNNIRIESPLFKERINTISSVSILTAIKNCYDTPRVQNFIEAKKAINGEEAKFEGIVYDDADIYKILEGASYILHQEDNEQLESELDKLIEIIADAQEANGYITTKHTIHPEMKWVCLDAHEMYNMGHLIEAAVAHKMYSDKDNFLNIGIKAADYLCEKFGQEQTKWIPGHQEIELALLKLYRVTNNPNYIKLCGILLDSRGRGYGWINNDYKDKAVFIPNQKQKWNCEYHQDSKPLNEIEKVEGHAVRAMYMYTAMAEIGEHNDNKYIAALERVWENLVYKNMYITGGIGSTKENEGFTCDYDLPNATAYCETCASVGMVFWNSKMFEITKNPKYLDVIERELKNGILSGLSLDGKKFFYDNPLASLGDVDRSEWFETSCCPTQLMRFIPQIGNFIFYEENDYLVIAQPISASLTTDKYNLSLTVTNDKIKIENKMETSQSILVRVPLNCTLKANQNLTIENGFIKIQVEDQAIIDLDREVRIISSSPKVTENNGKVAVMYNGFVYCVEEIDNPNSEMVLPNDYIVKIEENKINEHIVDKIFVYDYQKKCLELIPYYAWNNRGKAKMNVWIDSAKKDLY